MSNLGLLYNKYYFDDLEMTANGKASMSKNNSMKIILEHKLEEKKKGVFDALNANEQFKLKTIYPGLLVGSGYNHAIGGKEIEDEFKLGYYFDHTTGLPVIPGSSIKGVLRYACEVNNFEYLKNILKKIDINLDDYEGKKIIDHIFNGLEYHQDNNKTNYSKNISIYKRDIFFDAVPLKSGQNLFGDDYITPHEDPLKDPKLIKFLRVQPEVIFNFNFRLNDLKIEDNTLISANQKAMIFKQIILDLGLGAKTNVGYGQFTEEKLLVEDEIVRNPKENVEQQHSRPKKQFQEEVPFKAHEGIKNGNEFEGNIFELDNNYCFIEFTVNSSTCKTRKNIKSLKLKDSQTLAENDKVIIKIKKDFNYGENINCQVRKI